MKLTLSCAALVLGVGMIAAVPAMAQDDAAAPAAEAHHGHKKGGPVAAALADLTLTPDQQKTVDAAQADAQTKMKALHDDTTTDPKAKRKQGMDIQKDETDKVRAALTDDQKTQFDAKIADARAKMKAKHDAAGGDAAAPAATN